MSGDNRTSSDLGGAPDGMGASTGADPRGPSVGGGQDEGRSFEPKEPGHTAPEGEGGGAMSGRGQEGPDAGDMAATTDGMAGDAADGANETSGTGSNSTGGTGADASGDAHLGQDGRKLGDPMNAQRQVPSNGANDGLANGSGAD